MRGWVLALFLVLAAPVLAAPLPDAAQEARAQDLFRGFRCPVCQNQSIVDSEAPLAEDLRTIVRERVAAGDSNTEIEGFLVARYGEFILLRPRLSLETLLLWGAPLIALLAGLALAARSMVRRRVLPGETAEKGLSTDEKKRLDDLLAPEKTEA